MAFTHKVTGVQDHKHDTAAEARECTDWYEHSAWQSANEFDADAAYERHLENAGWQEAELQNLMEARAGVIPFDEAYAEAMAS